MSRRRSIARNDALVWCPAGKWGGRRVRVTECYGVVRSEDVYAALIFDKSNLKLQPGAMGTAEFRLGEGDVTIDWELRPNAVWRCGRLFLKCGSCCHRCTRLYKPLAYLELRCRRCYGLSYKSRALHNYRDSLWGRGPFARVFMTTQKEWSYMATQEARQARRQAAIDRWNQRRSALKRFSRDH